MPQYPNLDVTPLSISGFWIHFRTHLNQSCAVTTFVQKTGVKRTLCSRHSFCPSKHQSKLLRLPQTAPWKLSKSRHDCLATRAVSGISITSVWHIQSLLLLLLTMVADANVGDGVAAIHPVCLLSSSWFSILPSPLASFYIIDFSSLTVSIDPNMQRLLGLCMSPGRKCPILGPSKLLGGETNLI